MAQSPAITPPPGITSNFINPANRTPNTVALHTVCLSVVTIWLSLNTYSRYSSRVGFGTDDSYCLLVAYFLTVVFSALLIASDTRGLGRHLWDIPVNEVAPVKKLLAIAECVYLLTAATIKISCLFFYKRIFIGRVVKCIILSIVAVLIIYLILLLCTILQCKPVARSWDPLVPGTCFRNRALPYTSGALGLASDVFIIALPIPSIWRLAMATHRKLATILYFGIGIFVCITSTAQLCEISRLVDGLDSTWNLSLNTIFPVLEVNLGLMCASSNWIWHISRRLRQRKELSHMIQPTTSPKKDYMTDETHLDIYIQRPTGVLSEIWSESPERPSFIRSNTV